LLARPTLPRSNRIGPSASERASERVWAGE
jgi:hypothetical protein